jgi:hypothetical protein
MAPTVKDLLACLDEMCPFAWALPEDRVGLQVGDPGWPAATVLVALEVSEAVVAEALAHKAQVLLTHHPLIYQAGGGHPGRPGPGKIAGPGGAGRAGGGLLSHQPGYGAGGLKRAPGQEPGAGGPGGPVAGAPGPLVKLTVFVPLGYEDRVRTALVDDRVGVIGRYAHCSFAGRGQGTYFPLEGAQPFRGEVAALSRAQESRLEVLAPESRVPAALARLRAAHPYEEVAYDVYPLANPGLTLGFGRVGRWPGTACPGKRRWSG